MHGAQHHTNTATGLSPVCTQKPPSSVCEAMPSQHLSHRGTLTSASRNRWLPTWVLTNVNPFQDDFMFFKAQLPLATSKYFFEISHPRHLALVLPYIVMEFLSL